MLRATGYRRVPLVCRGRRQQSCVGILGQLHLRLGQSSEAERWGQIAWGRGDHDGARLVGDALAARGELNAALDTYRQAAALGSTSASDSLARWLVERGEVERALVVLTRPASFHQRIRMDGAKSRCFLMSSAGTTKHWSGGVAPKMKAASRSRSSPTVASPPLRRHDAPIDVKGGNAARSGWLRFGVEPPARQTRLVSP